jgi:hypothetical protein
MLGTQARNPAREAGFPLVGRESGQRSDLGLFRVELFLEPGWRGHLPQQAEEFRIRTLCESAGIEAPLLLLNQPPNSESLTGYFESGL